MTTDKTLQQLADEAMAEYEAARQAVHAACRIECDAKAKQQRAQWALRESLKRCPLCGVRYRTDVNDYANPATTGTPDGCCIICAVGLRLAAKREQGVQS